MPGGKDISAETDVRKLLAKLFEIHNIIESYGATCIMCTIETRNYTLNHLHYVDPEACRKIMNCINKKLTKRLKMKIILMVGNTYP